MRALVILEAARHIGRMHLTAEQGAALLELELIASRAADSAADAQGPDAWLEQLEAAWRAFEASMSTTRGL